MPIRLWLSLAALLFAHGCASTYSPPGPVVPLFREQGELSVGANFRPAMPTRGANAYLAVAPSEHTRAFVSGSLARYDGRRTSDHAERTMHERNHTTQIEAAFGWGTVSRTMIVEALAGIGYGTTSANACRRNVDINGDYGEGCELWVDSHSWFLRPFFQAETGRRWNFGQVGAGARVSLLRYSFDRLMGEPSASVAYAPTFEPFVSCSGGFTWGKIELQFQLPIVLTSPDVHFTRVSDQHRYSAQLIEMASPRFTFGVRMDVDKFWRNQGT